MRKFLLLSSAVTLASLTGCGFVGGALVGNALWSDGYELGMDDWQVNGFGAGSAVVCLGADADIEPADSYVISGRVVQDVGDRTDVGNLIPCQDEPYRVLTVEDADGVQWDIGYAWIAADGWDQTPAVGIWEDTRVEVVVRSGLSEGSESAGFVVHDAEGMAFAMEAGFGEPALSTDDIPLEIGAGSAIGTIEHDCGDASTVSIEFTSDSDSLTLYPGEDESMFVGSSYYTTCNINSIELTDDCDDVSETSWVMFR